MGRRSRRTPDGIRKAIKILENERPGCGEKITYTEEEKCEAYDVAIHAMRKEWKHEL